MISTIICGNIIHSITNSTFTQPLWIIRVCHWVCSCQHFFQGRVCNKLKKKKSYDKFGTAKTEHSFRAVVPNPRGRGPALFCGQLVPDISVLFIIWFWTIFYFERLPVSLRRICLYTSFYAGYIILFSLVFNPPHLKDRSVKRFSDI